jgi:hypothetical protein
MRRVNVNALLRLHLDPAIDDTPAGENEHMRAVFVDNREFQITFERCAGDGLPHAQSLDGKSNPALISINGNRKG